MPLSLSASAALRSAYMDAGFEGRLFEKRAQCDSALAAKAGDQCIVDGHYSLPPRTAFDRFFSIRGEIRECTIAEFGQTVLHAPHRTQTSSSM